MVPLEPGGCGLLTRTVSTLTTSGQTPAGSVWAESPSRVSRLLPKDTRPKGSDVHGGNCIGVALVVARHTSKLRLIRTVGARVVPALRAGARCTARVNEYNRDAVAGGLVLDEAHQFAEGPRGCHALESLAALEAIADAVQSFQDDDRVIVAQGNVNDRGADLVIQIAHIPRIFALSRLDAVKPIVALVAPAQVSRVLPSVSCLLAAEDGDTVRRGDGCQSHDTQVNANECGFTVTDGRRRGYADGQRDIPVVTALKQFSIALGEQEAITVLGRNAQHEPQVVPALSSRNTQNEAVVVWEDTVRINAQPDALRAIDFRKRDMLVVPGTPLSIKGTGKRCGGVDSHAGIVGRKSKPIPRGSINQLVQLSAAGSLIFTRSVKAELDSLTESKGGILKPSALTLCGFKYLGNYCFCTVHRRSVA